MNRRTFTQAGLASAALLAHPSTLLGKPVASRFPRDFLWGASTAGHQTEGNNVSSDFWHMEHCAKTAFAEPSGDATNSFELWRTDLDLVRSLGLNSYRFSLEWSRIEPERGYFSPAMLEHYRAVVAGCLERGIKPVVTFNHFSCPRWFAASGGWSNPDAPDLFAKYCEVAAKALARDIAYAITLNEPNLPSVLSWAGLPEGLYQAHRAMLDECARSLGVADFSAGFMLSKNEFGTMIPIIGAAHRKGRAAIKAVRPDLPVGLSLAIADDQAVGENSRIIEKRDEVYGPWFDFGADDDFIGVQNYDRMRIDAKGPVPAPTNAPRNFMGTEVYAPSLAGAVSFAHAVTKKPVLVTEHGLGSDDDNLRETFISEALAELKNVVVAGVPVIGYMHWSLLDNFEWYFGYGPKFGLASVDRRTQGRTLKQSARTFGEIVRSNRN